MGSPKFWGGGEPQLLIGETGTFKQRARKPKGRVSLGRIEEASELWGRSTPSPNPALCRVTQKPSRRRLVGQPPPPGHCLGQVAIPREENYRGLPFQTQISLALEISTLLKMFFEVLEIKPRASHLKKILVGFWGCFWLWFGGFFKGYTLAVLRTCI